MSKNDPTIRNRIEMIHPMTVTDLVTWCLQHDVDPDTATITGGHVRWQSPETEAEREQRLAYWAGVDARKERWERDTYARLREKFERVI